MRNLPKHPQCPLTSNTFYFVIKLSNPFLLLMSVLFSFLCSSIPWQTFYSTAAYKYRMIQCRKAAIINRKGKMQLISQNIFYLLKITHLVHCVPFDYKNVHCVPLTKQLYFSCHMQPLSHLECHLVIKEEITLHEKQQDGMFLQNTQWAQLPYLYLSHN